MKGNARQQKKSARQARLELFRRGKVRPGPVRRAFTQFANGAATMAGTHWGFLVAVVLIVSWFVTGPLFGWSDTWQLYANTFTTVVTFLMVFLIQSTQNRDAKAIHLKLDELLRATPGAHEEYMEAEEEDLEEILREKAIVTKRDPSPPDDKKEARGNGDDKERKRAS